MSSAQRNYVPPEEEQEQFPAPLEFFTKDAIHPDNLALMDHEQRRWRLLGFRERFRLRRRVNELAKQLKEANYNQLAKEIRQLAKEFRRLKAEYQSTTFINDEARREAAKRIIQVKQRGKIVRSQLDELKSTYEDYQHFAGWLEYEAIHRRELKAEDKRERKIRREMRREAKWLEHIILDTWRKAPGCHYTYTNKSQKERTLVPKIEFSIIKPDAHLFYVSASKKVLFGYKLTLPPSVMAPALYREDVLKNMCIGTKRQVDAIFSETNQLMIRVSRVDSPDALPTMVKWRDVMRYFPKEDTEKLPYTIGITEGRVLKWFDFYSEPNILIAGKANSGKSNLVNGIIGTLATVNTPDDLRFVLIDMKGGIEMTHWEELPHLLWDVVKTVEEVKGVLERLVKVIRRRMTTFAAVKAKKISDYNKRVDQGDRMARVVLVIDEMNTFVGLKGLTEEIHNLIMMVVSQGRAAGVYAIMATQHPEVMVIPGRIKTNMSVRASGPMPSVSASQVILDSPEAARLPSISGRFAVAVGMDELVVQVPYITDEDIEGVVSSARRLYPDVANDLSDAGGITPLKIWDAQALMKAALQFLEGQLSVDQLHKMLGSESPGDRHLRKLKRDLVDEFKATGALTLAEDNSQWIIKTGVKNRQVLQPKPGTSNTSDENLTRHLPEELPELATELETEPEAEPI